MAEAHNSAQQRLSAERLYELANVRVGWMQKYLLVRVVCADVHNVDETLAAARVRVEITSAIETVG
jgi:hypothetical protein